MFTAKDFTRFPSIDGFAASIKNAGFSIERRVEKIGLKIKLHGTNGGVRVGNGCVVPQSRNRDLPLDDPATDNAGFGAWVGANADYFRAAQFGPEFIIFGEWAGAGVQDTDAVNQLPEKHFFIFAVQTATGYIVEPEAIAAGLASDCTNVHVLPWHQKIEIDRSDRDSLEAAAEEISAMTEACGKEDPYILAKFRISGPGEGFVGVIRSAGHGGPLSNAAFEGRTFKAKAEGHRVRRGTKAATVGFVVSSESHTMALSYATEARFRQGLREGVDCELSPTRTKDFIAWMCRDVAKEAVHELEAAGFEPKQITGVIAKASAQWYLERCKELA